MYVEINNVDDFRAWDIEVDNRKMWLPTNQPNRTQTKPSSTVGHALVLI